MRIARQPLVDRGVTLTPAAPPSSVEGPPAEVRGFGALSGASASAYGFGALCVHPTPFGSAAALEQARTMVALRAAAPAPSPSSDSSEVEAHVHHPRSAYALRTLMREATVERKKRAVKNNRHGRAVDGLAGLGKVMTVHREARGLSEEEKQRYALAAGQSVAMGPELALTNLSSRDIVKALMTPDTLIVADAHNAHALEGVGPILVATGTSVEDVRAARQGREGRQAPARVIAVGGGTAHDLAKALVGKGELVVVPTILSTNCFANNRSVLGDGAQSFSFQTGTPTLVALSVDEISSSPPDELVRWSRSGFGDYLAGVSASIDEAAQTKDVSRAAMTQRDPTPFEALEWIEQRFSGYDKRSLSRLVRWVFDSGLKDIAAGTNAGRVGSEHKFYKMVLELDPSLRHQGPTHGEIVAVGTLVNAYVLGKVSGDDSVYRQLRGAFEKLTLPTSWAELKAINFPQDVLVRALAAIPPPSLLPSATPQLLDEIFGPRA